MASDRPNNHRGLISLFLLALAWAALDDITTDNATTFVFEYFVLLAISAWFVFLSYRLWRDGYRRLSAGTGLIILAAVWSVASLPPGGIPIPSLMRNTVLFAFAWGLFLGIWLLFAGWIGGSPTSPPDDDRVPSIR